MSIQEILIKISRNLRTGLIGFIGIFLLLVLANYLVFGSRPSHAYSFIIYHPKVMDVYFPHMEKELESKKLFKYALSQKENGDVAFLKEVKGIDVTGLIKARGSINAFHVTFLTDHEIEDKRWKMFLIDGYLPFVKAVSASYFFSDYLDQIDLSYLNLENNYNTLSNLKGVIESKHKILKNLPNSEKSVKHDLVYGKNLIEMRLEQVAGLSFASINEQKSAFNLAVKQIQPSLTSIFSRLQELTYSRKAIAHIMGSYDLKMNSSKAKTYLKEKSGLGENSQALIRNKLDDVANSFFAPTQLPILSLKNNFLALRLSLSVLVAFILGAFLALVVATWDDYRKV